MDDIEFYSTYKKKIKQALRKGVSVKCSYKEHDGEWDLTIEFMGKKGLHSIFWKKLTQEQMQHVYDYLLNFELYKAYLFFDQNWLDYEEEVDVRPNR